MLLSAFETDFLFRTIAMTLEGHIILSVETHAESARGSCDSVGQHDGNRGGTNLHISSWRAF